MKVVKTNENEYQYLNEMPVVFPFGPAVYLDHITEKGVEELDGHIETCLLYTSPSPRDSV